MFFTFHTPAGNHVQTANVKLGVESMVKSLEVLTKEEDDNDDGPKKKDDDGDDDIGHRHDSCDDFHTSQEALLKKPFPQQAWGSFGEKRGVPFFFLPWFSLLLRPAAMPGMVAPGACWVPVPTHVCIGIASWGARSASYAANMPGIKGSPP